jgi:hypothetical protein
MEDNKEENIHNICYIILSLKIAKPISHVDKYINIEIEKLNISKKFHKTIKQQPIEIEIYVTHTYNTGYICI